MTCPHSKTLIRRRLLSQGIEAAEAARHHASCGECRALIERFERLEASLDDAFGRLHVSAAFDARLGERVRSLHVITHEDRSREKERMQREYEFAMARLRREWFSLPALVEALQLVAPLCLVVWGFVGFGEELTRVLAPSGYGSLLSHGLFAVVVLGVTLWFRKGLPSARFI